MNSSDIAAQYAWSQPGGLIEKVGIDPDQTELWCYTDAFSYSRGEHVAIRVHSTNPSYDLEIVRDGARPETVLTRNGLPGHPQETPDNAYEVGCSWDEALGIDLDETWEPGFYLLIVRTLDEDSRIIEREHFFIVRPESPAAVDLLLIHATSTLLAYNDWGGANHYRGLPDGLLDDVPAPMVSSRRPIARGMLRKPIGAPRNINSGVPPIGWIPRHPPYEWAWHTGHSRHHADAGWATYERPFTVWAEENGYRVGHITQTDLHLNPTILDGHACIVAVGHDEYWSWEMRDVVDAFVDRGGRFARFGGNYIWQVRMSEDGGQQSCYRVPQADPMTEIDKTRVTTAWDWDEIGRPGAQTVGVTGFRGCYIRYGSAVPRASGGFTVYRPAHWALQGTDLSYGDVFGADPINIAAFEVDGLDYTFRLGLPYPTGVDGAPEGVEIIAMAPAVAGETDSWKGQVPLGGPITEVEELIYALNDNPPEHMTNPYGAAMIVSFERGAGSVFTAGTTEWVSGLSGRDPFTEKITKNVLDTFTKDAL